MAELMTGLESWRSESCACFLFLSIEGINCAWPSIWGVALILALCCLKGVERGLRSEVLYRHHISIRAVIKEVVDALDRTADPPLKVCWTVTRSRSSLQSVLIPCSIYFI